MAQKSDQSIFQTGLNWLRERLPLNGLAEFAAKKKVPLHSHSLWYYLGGIALILLVIQFATGILLTFYYIPEINNAHASVLFINSQIDFGWFFRSMHSWGANFMIAAVFIHMFSAFFMKAYRAPRELTWLSGFALLFLSLAFGFTGYLLPWDEISFFATKIGLDIANSLPLVGPTIAELLRGGTEVGQGTISRFYVIHVILLPLATLLLLGVHLLLIQVHGMSEPESFKRSKQKAYEPFFPDFILKDAMIWLLVINIISTVVVLSPWGIGAEADPFAAAPAGIKPEWYFLAMFQFLKFIPAHLFGIEGELLGILIISAVGAILACAPFIDKGKNPTLSKAMDIFGLIVLIAFIGLTYWGYIA